MKHLSNPIEHVLNCIQKGVIPTEFDILNAKDQLQEYERSIERLTLDYINQKNVLEKIDQGGLVLKKTGQKLQKKMLY